MGLEFTGIMLDDVIEYIGKVFADLSGLILLIVGVALGIMVIGAIISVVRGH